MNYSNLSSNEQRLRIAAYGFEQMVRPDAYTVREAMEMRDIAHSAFRSSDPAKSALRFAVFLKAAKMAYLKPHHILTWLSRSWVGAHAIREFAKQEYGLIDPNPTRRAA